MADEHTSRRRFVALGVTACSVGLAGCSEGSSTGRRSGGGSSRSVLLDVDNQEGTGESITVAAAGAPVRFYVAVSTGDTRRGTSDTVPANTTQTEFRIDLDPPLTRSGTVEVAIHDAADDQQLGLIKAIQYTDR